MFLKSRAKITKQRIISSFKVQNIRYKNVTGKVELNEKILLLTLTKLTLNKSTRKFLATRLRVLIIKGYLVISVTGKLFLVSPQYTLLETNGKSKHKSLGDPDNRFLCHDLAGDPLFAIMILW